MANGWGGRRAGAGKRNFAPRVEMTEQTVQKLHKIVASERDPLTVLIGFVNDEELDTGTRMNAAAICLPYLFPKLSEMRIDSKSTVTHLDGGALMERIAEKIERLAASPPRMLEPVIEAEPEGDDTDVVTVDAAPPEEPAAD